MIEGCPHGPGNPALCRKCALENEKAAETMERLSDRIIELTVEMEAELAKMPPEQQAKIKKAAHERVMAKMAELEIVAMEQRAIDNPYRGTNIERWGHSAYQGAEGWSGLHLTREAAIHEGRSEYGGGSFWIARGTVCSPSQFLPDVDDILQTMADNAGDNVGEVADDWPSVSKEAEAELTELLKAWAEKHAECKFWLADGHEEEITSVTDE